MNQKEHSALEAKRLLDDLAPYFAKLERRIIEEMVAVCSWDEESDRKRRCLADRVTAIRDVQAQLKSVIAMGAPKREVGVV